MTAANPALRADRRHRAQRGIDLRSLPGQDAFLELSCGMQPALDERWRQAQPEKPLEVEPLEVEPLEVEPQLEPAQHTLAVTGSDRGHVPQ